MRHLTTALLLALIACDDVADDATARALPADAAAAPALALPAMVRGTTATITVTGFLPGEPVLLVVGGAVSGRPFCPRVLGGVCSTVTRPAMVADTARAGADGSATFSVDVPMSLPLDLVYLEAIARGGADRTPVLGVPVLERDDDDDLDGLPNWRESALGTDPLDDDSDDDGLDDGDEDDRGTDPLDDDSDDDGVPDGDDDDHGDDDGDDSDDDLGDDTDDDDLGDDTDDDDLGDDDLGDDLGDDTDDDLGDDDLGDDDLGDDTDDDVDDD